MSEGLCTYCDGAPIAFDELCEDCICGSNREQGRTEERHAIVTFLRRLNADGTPHSSAREHMAQCIERGEHLK